jgi:acyl-CoA thioesterase
MLFSQTLASIEPLDDGWRAEVGVDWSQGRAIFGGMVAAFGNAAMRFLVPADRPLRGLDVTFAGPALVGGVRMQAEVLRVGKSVTVAQAKLCSDGQTAAILTGIYGRARPVSVTLAPAPPAAARKADELHDLTASSTFKTPMFFQHFAARWAQGDRPFSGSTSRSSKIYVRHRDPVPLTESHVVALIDCVPPPILQMMTTPTVNSSLQWTMEFLHHGYGFAADAWWRIDTEVKASADGYCQETSLLIDPNGVTMAFSRHLVAFFV